MPLAKSIPMECPIGGMRTTQTKSKSGSIYASHDIVALTNCVQQNPVNSETTDKGK